MNERIRELADQVMKDAKGGLNFEQFYEKFAELIVQDCVNVLQDNGMWDSRVSDVLDEHFGVEE